jgi:hypothetical protein
MEIRAAPTSGIEISLATILVLSRLFQIFSALVCQRVRLLHQPATALVVPRLWKQQLVSLV